MLLQCYLGLESKELSIAMYFSGNKQPILEFDPLGGAVITWSALIAQSKISLSLLKLAYTRLTPFTIDDLLWQNL